MDQAHVFIDDGLDEAPEALNKLVLAVSQEYYRGLIYISHTDLCD